MPCSANSAGFRQGCNRANAASTINLGFWPAAQCKVKVLQAQVCCSNKGQMVRHLGSPRRLFNCSAASAGTLASAMSGLLLMRVASIFLGSTARGFTFSAELYGGLLIFVGWVLVDTQQVGAVGVTEL